MNPDLRLADNPICASACEFLWKIRVSHEFSQASLTRDADCINFPPLIHVGRNIYPRPGGVPAKNAPFFAKRNLLKSEDKLYSI